MHPEARHRDASRPGSPSQQSTDALWYVTRTYVVDGRPVVDIVRPGTPGAIDGVPLLLPGGTAAAYAHTPLTPSPSGKPPAVTELRQTSLVRVLVVDRRIVAEAVAWPQQDLGFVDKQPEPTKHQDHPGTPTARDHALKNSDGKLILDARGELLLESPTAIRLQVGPDGVFRLSRDGDATEAPALGFALVEYLDELVTWIGALSAQVATLSAKVAVLPPLPPAGPVIPPWPDPTAGGSPPSPSRALVSDAVRIPSDAAVTSNGVGAG